MGARGLGMSAQQSNPSYDEEDALERAMLHELSALEAYARAAELVKGRDCKAFLRFLAREELTHLEALEERIAEHKTRQNVPAARELKKKYKTRIEREVEGQVESLIRKAPRSGALTWREIIKFSIAGEKKAMNLYKLNARMAPDASLRPLFEKLANQEKEHIKTLQAIERLLNSGIIRPQDLGKGSSKS